MIENSSSGTPAAFSLSVPFFEVGPKAFLYGRELLRLAKHADRLCDRYQVQIIFTPQYVDIPILAQETGRILVFAQHMDAIEVGRGVGSVLPEALKEAGADGVLLNHYEKRLPLDELEKAILRAGEVGLATMVCADTLDDSRTIARLHPNIIIAEPPELIGAGKRNLEAQQAIRKINTAIWDIDPNIRVLHGAGISCGQDVYDVISAGAQGTGSTSGIFLSQDPFRILEEMIQAVREAWDQNQKHMEKQV
ncbi:MAG: triose-phosphate isomerase [Leptolinea sp.]|jgi:triosephosphate isomerase|nr:triose-phosphate isomerase [Leptolinea sp.]